MTEFTNQVAEKWNISPALSELVCDAFQKGDTPYYLAEYRPEVAIELPVSIVWEIFDYLTTLSELEAKKKRVLNALRKANRTTPAIEHRVLHTANTFDLDDLLLPLRPNPRSKGQLAIKKGLEPLADAIAKQEELDAPIEELAEGYVGKDPSLKSADDVLQGVKDVLAERLAYDDTVRNMVREFAYEDGYFEITPKNRHDQKYAEFVGKQIPVAELSKQDFLTLYAAEENKEIRFRLNVQLFRITELLRHHFIQDPDFSGFDLLCQVIDDSWQRLLEPIIERDVKLRLLGEGLEWISGKIVPELEKKYDEQQRCGALCIVNAAHPKRMLFIVVSGNGDLLGATSEKRLPDGKIASVDRMRQFFIRHRPTEIVIIENEGAEAAETALKPVLPEGEAESAPISRFALDPSVKNPGESEWLKKKYETLLDDEMRLMYGAAILRLVPIQLIQHIGSEFYSVHPLQGAVPRDQFVTIINRIITDSVLRKGIPVKDIIESPFKDFTCLPSDLLQAIYAAESKESLASKTALLSVPGMTEVAYRNIAGFIVLPNADDARDRSVVHPDHYPLLDEVGDQISVSIDTIMSDPEVLRSYATEDFVRKIFIEKKLIPQIRLSARSSTQAMLKSKRKLKLSELKEGSIVSGKITNITPFGVFVNINAVCDGLVHISQLADEYVESPEQVVALHDKVDVRILKVDVKKRRISLSMKNLGLGRKGPRVRPTQGQLNNLAEFFKNR